MIKYTVRPVRFGTIAGMPMAQPIDPEIDPAQPDVWSIYESADGGLEYWRADFADCEQARTCCAHLNSLALTAPE